MKNDNPFWDPIELVNKLVTKKIAPESLLPRQRRIIIKYYMERQPEVSNMDIAKLLGLNDMYVHRVKGKILRQDAWEMDEIVADVRIIITTLKKRKEELQRRALQQGDLSLTWKMECDFINKLQELGMVYKAPEQIRVGRLETDTETALKDFFKKIGVMSVEQFVLGLGKLHGNGGGNGQGGQADDREQDTNLLVAAGKPHLSNRED